MEMGGTGPLLRSLVGFSVSGTQYLESATIKLYMPVTVAEWSKA
jgi:hypothetical protein